MKYFCSNCAHVSQYFCNFVICQIQCVITGSTSASNFVIQGGIFCFYNPKCKLRQRSFHYHKCWSIGEIFFSIEEIHKGAKPWPTIISEELLYSQISVSRTVGLSIELFFFKARPFFSSPALLEPSSSAVRDVCTVRLTVHTCAWACARARVCACGRWILTSHWSTCQRSSEIISYQFHYTNIR